MPLLIALSALGGCVAAPAPEPTPSPAPEAPLDPGYALGGTVVADGATFAVRAPSAERLELLVFAEPFGEQPALTVAMDATEGRWTAAVSADELAAAGVDAVWYGLRAWGPNWGWDPDWTPGSELGFVTDVDQAGHRFNPNKVLWDPYARELSHDPEHAGHAGWHPYTSGPDHRTDDTATLAPKGLALPPPAVAPVLPPRDFADEVIYEVHVRGLTMLDESIPADLRGTYAGAALRAPALADLGITAIEFLPVFETPNDQNERTPEADGDNYWGYSTLNFFAPDRRYAADRSPGGPTAEFRAMVQAFHDVGIAVYLDVVYNHTSEGGVWGGDGAQAPLFSWRGLDNPGYYELADDPRHYVDNNGVGPNVNAVSDLARDLVLDSLHYWVDAGVDGFRFDLTSVLGNACDRGCFAFDPNDPDGILRRAAAELPDTALIAEPWGIGAGTYQVGNFPAGWSEWNDRFRNDVRDDQNRMDAADVTPGQLANRLSGSWDLFGDDGRPPSASVNFVVAHDGLTLADLYACNDRVNDQPWPYGPSDGGTDDNRSWDQGGDAVDQHHAARTGMALLLLSAGTPMFTGGDEFLRSQRCNNNPYNLDSPGNWLSGTGPTDEPDFFGFTQRALAFRAAHPALRPRAWRPDQDADGDGVPLVAWFSDAGPADADYLDDPAHHVIAWRLDADEAGDDDAESIFVAYNGWDQGVHVAIPEPRDGAAWSLVADTHPWLDGNWLSPADEAPLEPDDSYLLGGRSVVVLVER